MTKRLLLFGFVMIQIIFFGCNSTESKYKSFIGKEYRSLTEFKEFKGFEELGGTLINKLENNEYTLSHYKNDSIDLIAFEKIVKQPIGKVKYLLIDILEIKGLAKNQYISYGMCRLNKQEDSEIIAVYVDSDTEYYKNINKAWRANREKGKIESIDIKGIDCINEGFGEE